MKINYTINEDTQRILFACLLTINNRLVVLSYEQHREYLKPELRNKLETLGDNPNDFEEIFLYPVSAFLPPEPGKGAHAMYQEIVNSNYFKTGKWHELQWYELNQLVQNHKYQSEALIDLWEKEEQLTQRYIEAELFIIDIKWYERIFNFRKVLKFLTSRLEKYKF